MEFVRRIAIVGCGPWRSCFPALLSRDDCRVTVLVDRNLRRAEALQGLAPKATTAANASSASEEFDAAIVALPHTLHADVCVELLRLGKHVLVEKPMAITSIECDAMIDASRKNNVTLTVGQMRRYCPAISTTKALLERGVVGEIESFDVRDGVVFNWPVASDFQFRKETAGGGVLFDTGAHTLDMALWLLGDLHVTDYRDDAFGGVEGDCEIDLLTPNGATGSVRLSRTRKLRNSMMIAGSRGTLELFFYDNRIALRDVDQRTGIPQVIQQDATAVAETSIWPLMFRLQADAWLRCVRGEGPSPVGGEEGKRVVELIQQCYHQRRPLELPWMSSTVDIANA